MVSVFKTNILSQQDKNMVINALVANFGLSACSIDLEDIDKVLRIVSSQPADEQHYMLFVQQLGYNCAYLD
ncbi:hypothetical protein LX64_04060 [Chitinophaga skermanii]|uniref:Uncharacterized protein n=1 Tax=Chitinophaga skermanii TaxID=331697 RepID=A0A327QFA4_9BACT|nr:hypothetical protein [Chitinophaga skermanii]RAJ00357.1 hypothetical protein LX64_04060 [Chitinophaga skermanii]